jgi:hypothetical protein
MTTQHNPALAALRRHVTGAIERGEAQAIVEIKPSKREQQHTAGPWKTGTPIKGRFCVYGGRNGVGICVMQNTQTISEWEREKYGEHELNLIADANARLIAAAPTMLSALQTALEVMGDTYDARDSDDDGESIRDIITAAIAAATGEEVQG